MITLFKSSKNTQEGHTSDSTECVSVVQEINYSEASCSDNLDLYYLSIFLVKSAWQLKNAFFL